jgi:hypothetical protein
VGLDSKLVQAHNRAMDPSVITVIGSVAGAASALVGLAKVLMESPLLKKTKNCKVPDTE